MYRKKREKKIIMTQTCETVLWVSHNPDTIEAPYMSAITENDLLLISHTFRSVFYSFYKHLIKLKFHFVTTSHSFINLFFHNTIYNL